MKGVSPGQKALCHGIQTESVLLHDCSAIRQINYYIRVLLLVEKKRNNKIEVVAKPTFPHRPIIRGSNSGQPLLTSPQPQIMMAPTGAQHNQFYPPSQGGTLQPLLPQGKTFSVFFGKPPFFLCANYLGTPRFLKL